VSVQTPASVPHRERGYPVGGSLCGTVVVPFPSQAPRDSASRRTQFRNLSAP
jgi:hypothetical protein